MNWGPLPKFTQQLTLLSPESMRGRIPWLAGVDLLDNLWAEYIRQHPSLWPDNLPLLPAVNVSEEQLVGQYSDVPPIVQTFIECQVWLINRSVKALTNLFLPLASDLPGRQNRSYWIDLTLVSKQAIKWALALYALDQYGVKSVLRHHFHPEEDDQGTQADLIALHLLIEDFVNTISDKIKGFTPSSCKRPLGGLRTLAFLTNYPQIRIYSSAWEQALSPFISQSYLTQLVYADLVFHGNPQWDKLIHFTDGNRAWRDLWYAHLARSLLGALLSKPINWEPYVTAQQKLNQIDQAATQWASKEPLFSFQKPRDKEKYRGLKAARNRYHQRQNDLAIQFTQRISRLASAFQETRPNLIYLQIRLIDILLRHIITLSTPTMHQEWRNICLNEVSPRPGVNLFDPDRNAYQTFENILFGQTLSQTRSILGPEQIVTLREHCLRLFNIPNDWEDLVLSNQTGVNRQSAEGLAARFGRIGIRLPMGELNEHGPTPVRLLTSNWCIQLASQLEIETTS